jgi:hypothetical protein
MIEFTGLLAISSFTDNLNVFLFQKRNQSVLNNRLATERRFRNYIRFIKVRCYFKAITTEVPQWLRKDRLLLR